MFEITVSEICIILITPKVQIVLKATETIGRKTPLKERKLKYKARMIKIQIIGIKTFISLSIISLRSINWNGIPP